LRGQGQPATLQLVDYTLSVDRFDGDNYTNLKTLHGPTPSQLFAQWQDPVADRTFQVGPVTVKIGGIFMDAAPSQASGTFTPNNPGDNFGSLLTANPLVGFTGNGSVNSSSDPGPVSVDYPCGGGVGFNSFYSSTPWPGTLPFSFSGTCDKGPYQVSNGVVPLCAGLGVRLYDAIANEVDLNFTVCANYQVGNPPSVAVDHIEVVQVIQDPDNGVPLVKGKTAVARVFLREDGTNLTSSLTGIAGTLTATDQSGTPLKSSPQLLNGGSAIAMPAGQLNEDNPNHSLNFLLPLDWTQADQLNLTATASSGSNTTTGAQSVEFADFWPKPFKVAYLLVCTQDLSGKMVCPAVDGLENTPLFMRTTFPVSGDGLSYTYAGTIPWNVQMGSAGYGGPRTELARFTLVLLKIYQLTNLGADQLVAWLPSNTGIPFDLSNVTTLGWDHIGWVVYWGCPAPPGYCDGGHSLARGIALNLGLSYNSNAPPIRLAGFDTVGMQVVPSNTNSLMGPAAQWISKYQYTALMSTDGAPPVTPPAAASTSSRRPASSRAASAPTNPPAYLVVSGAVSADGGAGHLDSAYNTTGGASGRASDPAGTYCLRFTLSAGSPVDYCFTPPQFDSDPPLDPIPFAVKAPYPAGTTRVALRNGSVELAALNAASAPPTLTINSPQTGDSWSGNQTLSWLGSDPDGNSLTYSVLYSSDNGTTWIPLELDTQDTQFNVDCTQILGGSQVWFRVMATSGLSSTSVDAGPITVVQNPKVALAATAVDFGNLKTGLTADQNVVLNNTGTGPVQVDTAISGSTAFVLPSATQGILILAGGTRQIPVRFAPSATGPQNGTLAIAVHDSADTTLTVTLTGAAFATDVPSIAVSPAALAFGSVNVKQTNDQKTVVSNLGTAALHIASLQTGNAAFSVTAPSTPYQVDAGKTVDVTVRFAPQTAGAVSDTLTIATDDPAKPKVTVALTGTGAGTTPTNAPAISVTPASLNFGSAPVGQTVALTVTIQNTGNATLNVRTVSVSGAAFSLSGVPATPFAIAAGGKQSFTLTMTPSVAGPQTGQLNIGSDDPNTPSWSGALTGTATASAATNPAPVLDTLIPGSVTSGGLAFQLTVNGSNFVNGSTVQWNGAGRTTTFVSAYQLRAAIPAADIASAGSAAITVQNPAPGGGTSAPRTVTIAPAGQAAVLINHVDASNCPMVGALLTAMDRNGNAITGLNEANLKCTEDGTSVPCSAGTAANGSLNLSLALVVDTSASQDLVDQAKSVAKAIIGFLDGNADRLALVQADASAWLVNGFTQLSLAAAYIDQLQKIGTSGTALYDAIGQALGLMSSERGRRQAVVVLTADGNSGGTITDAQTVLAQARSGAAAVFPFALGQGASDAGLQTFLNQLALDSSGVKIGTPFTSLLGAQQIGGLLANQYLVQYSTPHQDGLFHVLGINMASALGSASTNSLYRCGQ
jgi:Mg-chelatase subunit ChlD